MNISEKTWALVPIKTFDKAKSRLRSALSADQCATLARHMAEDVIAALQNAETIQGITVLGEEPAIAQFARELNCDFQTENSAADLSANLDAAAQRLKLAGIDTLLVLPSDLPMLRAADIDQLLSDHAGGLSLCPASRDGGTNALVISPPGTIEFCFGEQSARHHLDAANVAELATQIFSRRALSRDIDTPEDLLYFCRQSSTGCTADYLSTIRICETLSRTPAAALA